MRFLRACLWAIAGYVAGAVVGYFLILGLSPNRHDRGVEAAMTSAFTLGPLGALVGFLIGWRRGRPRVRQENGP
jgi:hypothetical protein